MNIVFTNDTAIKGFVFSDKKLNITFNDGKISTFSKEKFLKDYYFRVTNPRTNETADFGRLGPYSGFNLQRDSTFIERKILDNETLAFKVEIVKRA